MSVLARSSLLRAVVVISSLVGCGHSSLAGNSQPRSVILAFTTASQSDWVEQMSSGDDGSVVIQVEPSGSQLRVASGHQQEKKLSRRLDASPLRRTRILAKVQVDFSPREESASVVMQLSVDRTSGLAMHGMWPRVNVSAQLVWKRFRQASKCVRQSITRILYP